MDKRATNKQPFLKRLGASLRDGEVGPFIHNRTRPVLGYQCTESTQDKVISALQGRCMYFCE